MLKMNYFYSDYYYKLIVKYIIYLTHFIIDAETKKPFDKTQLATWRLECELGIIFDPDCPVDGGWSSWSSWSACQGSCDETGHRRRNRECVNPPPSKDGLPCSGIYQEIEPCFLTNCTVDDFRKLIQSDPIRLSGLRQLEAVPVLLEQCLRMDCPFEAIEAALATDNTWQLTSEALWNALLCVKRNLGCSVAGQWGNWNAWSTCGARCGKGLRWRQRKCDTPPPSDGRLICVGQPLQYEECEGDQCAIDKPLTEYTGGSWSLWGRWSECSEHCGTGIKRRTRQCIEKMRTSASSFTWGTYCRGQYDQLQICSNKKCTLNGGWSGWSAWGACSQSCGAGKRSRSRSCTRPMPFGGGTQCIGSRTEVGPCHLNPCNVFSHDVALFNGDSVLQYNFPTKLSTFFHFYIRFLPLSPTGTLLRKGLLSSPSVRLNLHKWHVCLDVSGPSKACVIPRLCSPAPIDPAAWHSVLVTFTNDVAVLRLDDSQVPIKGTFSCDPELENENVNIFIGNRFHGAVQEMMLNFIPLRMFIQKERKVSIKSDFHPTFASNMVYERANYDEAFVYLDDEYYIRVPCYNVDDTWRLELTMKPQSSTGLVLFIFDTSNKHWILITLHNSRIKFKLNLGERNPEIISSSECPVNEWLDISVFKKDSANIIEVTINTDERLHILLVDDRWKREKLNKMYFEKDVDDNTTLYEEICNTNSNKTPCDQDTPKLNCDEEFFIGGVPSSIRNQVKDDISTFTGIIASLKVNGDLIDLHDCSKERMKENTLEVSARTASVSGSYHEIMWGKTKKLNLTCLYSKNLTSSSYKSHWLFLDTGITGLINGKNINIYDTGRILRLTLEGDNELRGFYTCRSFYNKRSRNIITYGVIGEFKNDLAEPDFITILAIVTTISLVIFTLSWLTIEGIHDIRDGYGFFRDSHFSSEDEAEQICRYIDQNKHLIGSRSAVKLSKTKARRKARELASQVSFIPQEPEALMPANLDNISAVEEGVPTEPETLPALPNANSSAFYDQSYEAYRFEPSYVSSPRHGSNITTPGGNITSTSSVDSSPRELCSKLLMSKTRYSSKENLISRRVQRYKKDTKRSQLLTIKSSTFVNLSPGQRILRKFQQLKNADDSQ